ncbi:type I secretion system permease/ATPase [Ferrimonas marina]|uniref:ATP-binding cassette, subfamily C, LapB n=1 Tax=Ferrimonas marina TaxID=299255 RepID=A0A1M5XV43_9GAMM|nr:type I secretion system permease/ATPase [Ferrimonas marina]SHI03705.1 ATP-binding cassette, subfamily C, LapB [Ferrimonas marina]
MSEISRAVDATPPSPLLDNLMWLAGHYELAVNRHSVQAALPWVDGDLPLSHLEQAAARCGLTCRRLVMELSQLPEQAFPCLIALADEPPTLLLGLDEEEAELLEPITQTPIRRSRRELERGFLGQVVLLSPQLAEDPRFTPEQAEESQGHWFWGPLRKARTLYRDILLASVLINLFALVSPLFIMNVYDRVVPNLAYESLWVLAVGAGIAFAFDLMLKQIRAVLIDYAGKRTDLEVSRSLFGRILGMRLQHRPASTGALARQFGEFDSVREFIASSTLTTLVDLPFSLLFLAIIAWVAGPLVWPPIIAIGVMLAVTLALQPKLAHASREAQRYADLRHAHLYESITGLETIKSAGAEGPIQHSWEKMQAHSADWHTKSRQLTNLASHSASFTVQIATLAVVVLGVYKLEEGLISMGGIIAAVILTGRAISPMAQLIGLMSRAHHVKGTLHSLDQLMALPQDSEADGYYPDLGRLHGKIQVDDLHFRFDPQGDPILKGIDFRIQPGERVALIGRNGSGKSTLAKLLLGFLQPSQGHLRFDGRDIGQLHTAFLRHQVGYVPQDVRLFYGTIRDNILLGARQVSDAQLNRAVTLSGVSLFTDLDPQGLNRQVGESGMALSAGQRQAVALARALLNDPSILVLDEPSASLDARAELQLVRTLQQLPKDKTLVLITHKQPLLALSQRLLVLERGRLVANGPTEQVMAKLKQGGAE